MYRKYIYFASFVFLLGLASFANGTEGLLGEYYHGTAGNPCRLLSWSV